MSKKNLKKLLAIQSAALSGRLEQLAPVLKKVVLVAQDAAPSGCFELLEPVLKEQGFRTELFIGRSKPFEKTEDEIDLEVMDASIVIIGMSSSKELAKLEISAGSSALQLGIPYGFYGDVPSCWGRARAGSWFEDLASIASFYFAIDQQDADNAREVFPLAQCIATGNPLREEMAFPKFTREEVRKKLDITPNEKLVLAPGDKFAGGNMAMWSMTIDALTLLQEDKPEQKFQLILTTHPGDRTPQALYDELVSFSPIPARIINKDVFSSSDIVPGADVIVGAGGSICIEGVCQLIPVICLDTEVMMGMLEKINGSRKIEVVANGSAKLANGISLALTIDRMLNDNWTRLYTQNHQRKFYPKPTERGVALRRMTEFIVEYCKVD